MMRPAEQIITLDRERRVAFTQRARYRMGTLDAPFDLRDLTKPKKFYGALVAWLWACLVPADAADFPTPAELADAMPAEPERINALVAAFNAALAAGTVEKKTELKATGLSPASSSA